MLDGLWGEKMILKIIIVILILTGFSLYVIVHGSARKVDDEMQRRLDDEQARIVSEITKQNNESK